MAYQLYSIVQTYIGRSNDEKPNTLESEGVVVGSRCLEVDTGKVFVLDTERNWVEEKGDTQLLAVALGIKGVQEDALLELKKIVLGLSILTSSDLDKEI